MAVDNLPRKMLLVVCLGALLGIADKAPVVVQSTAIGPVELSVNQTHVSGRISAEVRGGIDLLITATVPEGSFEEGATLSTKPDDGFEGVILAHEGAFGTGDDPSRVELLHQVNCPLFPTADADVPVDCVLGTNIFVEGVSGSYIFEAKLSVLKEPPGCAEPGGGCLSCDRRPDSPGMVSLVLDEP